MDSIKIGASNLGCHRSLNEVTLYAPVVEKRESLKDSSILIALPSSVPWRSIHLYLQKLGTIWNLMSNNHQFP